jgi:hypothetical protein
MQMTCSARMTPEENDSESGRTIDEALIVALMTTRLLRAWHSGEAEAEESMQILWEAFCRMRSVSGMGFLPSIQEFLFRTEGFPPASQAGGQWRSEP